MGLGRRNPASQHHHVHRPRQPGDAGDALAAAAARNLAERGFRQGAQRVLGREPNVAGHRQLEADAHGILFHGADDRLGAALRRRDVPGEIRHAVALDLQERLDVAAGGVDAVPAADDDDAHVGVLSERLDDGRDLAAAAIGDDVERWSIEIEPADPLPGIDFKCRPSRSRRMAPRISA
jgi:hypothetical protein